MADQKPGLQAAIRHEPTNLPVLGSRQTQLDQGIDLPAAQPKTSVPSLHGPVGDTLRLADAGLISRSRQPSPATHRLHREISTPAGRLRPHP